MIRRNAPTRFTGTQGPDVDKQIYHILYVPGRCLKTGEIMMATIRPDTSVLANISVKQNHNICFFKLGKLITTRYLLIDLGAFPSYLRLQPISDAPL